MAKLTRKNLMVDEEKVRELARRRNTSESNAVRQVVEWALMADEFGEVIRELHARGTVEDVFGRLAPEEGAGEAAGSWLAPKSSTQAS
jgi:hypothetical protein